MKVDVKVVTPTPPKFLVIDILGSTRRVPIESFTDDELLEVGKQYGEALVGRASKGRADQAK